MQLIKYVYSPLSFGLSNQNSAAIRNSKYQHASVCRFLFVRWFEGDSNLEKLFVKVPIFTELPKTSSDDTADEGNIEPTKEEL